MSIEEINERSGGDQLVQQAIGHLKEAERDLAHGRSGEAGRDVCEALEELEEVEHRKPRLVEVTVDRQSKEVKAGIYIVSVFKTLVGVAADRELDVLKDGVLEPLDDNAEITIHGCETFVSHARTGGSS